MTHTISVLKMKDEESKPFKCEYDPPSPGKWQTIKKKIRKNHTQKNLSERATSTILAPIYPDGPFTQWIIHPFACQYNLKTLMLYPFLGLLPVCTPLFSTFWFYSPHSTCLIYLHFLGCLLQQCQPPSLRSQEPSSFGYHQGVPSPYCGWF